MRTFFAALAVIVLTACTPADTPVVTTVPADWQTIKAGELFTFKAPPDLKQEKIQGTDSFVQKYVSETMVLSFDYGWHSDPMDREGYERTKTTIDGREAYIVREDKMIGVHFPKVDDKTKLTMHVYLRGADPKDAQTIFRSIDFPEKEPEAR